MQAAEANETAGVIPRAASHLFEILNGTAPNSRQNSGLKIPTRYSIASMNGAQQNFAKSYSDKKWQMTATYVEVGFPDMLGLTLELMRCRYIMNNCGICCYRTLFLRMNELLLPSEKIPEAESFSLVSIK